MSRRWQWSDQYGNDRRRSSPFGVVDVAVFVAASGAVAYILSLLGLQ